MDLVKMTLPAAIRQELTLPGETLANVREMYKALTDEDKADLTTAFLAVGIDTSRQ